MSVENSLRLLRGSNGGHNRVASCKESLQYMSCNEATATCQTLEAGLQPGKQLRRLASEKDSSHCYA